MSKRVSVLFVCVGNSCRSPMAEAIARHSASDVIDASSAGVYPLGSVAKSTREVLLERGVPVDALMSKSLHDDAIPRPLDLIINMSGIPSSGLFPGCKVEDWDVDDPYGEDMETYRRICDDIESRVAELAARLRSGEEKGKGGVSTPPKIPRYL